MLIGLIFFTNNLSAYDARLDTLPTIPDNSSQTDIWFILFIIIFFLFLGVLRLLFIAKKENKMHIDNNIKNMKNLHS